MSYLVQKYNTQRFSPDAFVVIDDLTKALDPNLRIGEPVIIFADIPEGVTEEQVRAAFAFSKVTFQIFDNRVRLDRYGTVKNTGKKKVAFNIDTFTAWKLEPGKSPFDGHTYYILGVDRIEATTKPALKKEFTSILRGIK